VYEQVRVYEIESVTEVREIASGLDLRDTWIAVLGLPGDDSIWFFTNRAIGLLASRELSKAFVPASGMRIIGPRGVDAASDSIFFTVQQENMMTRLMMLCSERINDRCASP